MINGPALALANHSSFLTPFLAGVDNPNVLNHITWHHCLFLCCVIPVYSHETTLECTINNHFVLSIIWLLIMILIIIIIRIILIIILFISIIAIIKSLF